MKGIIDRIESLGLMEVRWGVYVCPNTGMFHICRNDQWLNEEENPILNFEVFDYGFFVHFENLRKLFTFDGISYMLNGKDYCCDDGIYTFSGDKERLMFLPKRRFLEKDGSDKFDLIYPIDGGQIVKRNKKKSVYLSEIDGWLMIEGIDEFDKVKEHNGALIITIKDKKYLYFIDFSYFVGDYLKTKNHQWFKVDGNMAFDAIYLFEFGVRVKQDGKYKLYRF